MSPRGDQSPGDRVSYCETGTGTVLLVVELFPSSPYELLPQHHALASVLIAQVASRPGEMADQVAVPVTATGIRLPVLELLPSSPCELSPQHQAVPSVLIPQVAS